MQTRSQTKKLPTTNTNEEIIQEEIIPEENIEKRKLNEDPNLIQNILSEEEIEAKKLQLRIIEEDVEGIIKAQDWLEASDLLAQILELKEAIFGGAAEELGDDYLKYGNALLQLATQNTDIFGSTANRIKEKQIGEAQKKEPEVKVPKKAFVCVDSDEEDLDNSGAEELNPVEDLEIAWEVLALASSIFEKNPNKQKELAEAKYLMGCVDMEGGNMDQAKSEFIESLAIREKILDKCDPLISDSLILIGITLHNLNQFKMAQEYFIRAEKHIRLQLEQAIEQKSPETTIQELKEKVAEVQSRLRELDTNPDEYERTKQIVREQILHMFGGELAHSTLAEPVTDLGIFGAVPTKKTPAPTASAPPEARTLQPRRITPSVQDNGSKRISPINETIHNSTHHQPNSGIPSGKEETSSASAISASTSCVSMASVAKENNLNEGTSKPRRITPALVPSQDTTPALIPSQDITLVPSQDQDTTPTFAPAKRSASDIDTNLKKSKAEEML